MKYKMIVVVSVLFFGIVYANENLTNRWIKERHIVRDSQLHLIWQDSRNVQYRKKSWDEAKRYCQNLTLTKRKEWRLPTLPELLSIVDYSRASPALISAFFFSSKSGYCWSSSINSTDKRYAWYVEISKGNTYSYSKEEEAFFRCVHNDK